MNLPEPSRTSSLQQALPWILTHAVKSPSGDNCQPFTFVQKSPNEIHVLHDADRARHVLNPNQQCSFLALGQLIETTSIAAARLGWDISFTHADQNPVAKLVFTRNENAQSELAPWIYQRHTDRRPFLPAEASVISGITAKLSPKAYGARVHTLHPVDETLLQTLAKTEGALPDIKDSMENTTEWIRFSQREVERTRDGLPMWNLGLRTMEAFALKMAVRYQWLRTLTRPIMRIQARRMAAVALRGAALFCFTAPDSSRTSFVETGRLAARIWLELTAAGYAAQPFTTSSLTLTWLKDGYLKTLVPAAHLPVFTQANEVLEERLAIKEPHCILWMLRAGRPPSPLPPRALTLRRPIVFQM
ncbi:MAG: hypothetical protein NDI61_09195 [Bdellovibrionaceae bacterium]|nr:hypothetical protein [Pseudobdellovibrionaceae bacterium]